MSASKIAHLLRVRQRCYILYNIKLLLSLDFLLLHPQASICFDAPEGISEISVCKENASPVPCCPILRRHECSLFFHRPSWRVCGVDTGTVYGAELTGAFLLLGERIPSPFTLFWTAIVANLLRCQKIKNFNSCVFGVNEAKWWQTERSFICRMEQSKDFS